jgi:hypothetical protein
VLVALTRGSASAGAWGLRGPQVVEAPAEPALDLHQRAVPVHIPPSIQRKSTVQTAGEKSGKHGETSKRSEKGSINT